MQNYYVHNLDSIAFEWGFFILPWYWLVYFLGYFFVFFMTERFSKKGLIKLSSYEIYYMMTRGFVVLLLGGRLGYVLFYNLNYYLKDPVKVFYLWEGGMSFHGALVALIFAAFFVGKKLGRSLFELSDPVATLVPLVLGFGRVANFINGELAGRVSDVPWAVIFPRLYDQSPRHPSQLYEAILEGFILFPVMLLTRKKLKNPGFQTLLFFLLYGMVQSLQIFR